MSPVRLPWPFGRRTPSDGPPSATPEDARGGASPVEAAPEVAAAPSLAPATGAWATLPPIQRTVSATPLVAPAAPFLADVPGHRPLPPIVQPLGHDTGSTAPPGLVIAHVATVPSLTSSAPMATRPVQRRASDAAPVAAPVDETAGRSTEPAGPAWSSPAAAAPSPAVGSAPVRRVAAVSPAATVTPAVRPLTRSPEPVAVARRSTGPATAAAASSFAPGRPGASPRAAVPGMTPMPGARATPPLRGTPPTRTVSRWAETASSGSPPPAAAGGLGAPLGATPATPSHPGVREVPSPSPSASPAPAAGSPAAPRPQGTAALRKAGLGAPLASPPAGAVAQRLPMAGPARRPGATSAPGASTTPPTAAASAVPSATSLAAAAPAPARPLPVLPVARRQTDEGRDPEPVAGAARALAPSHPAHAQPAPASPAAPASGAASSSRATPGARPLRPVVTAQRDAAGTAPAAPGTSVPARWASGDDLPATVRSLPLNPPNPLASPDEEPVPLQRLGAVPAASPAPSPVMPREIVFPARDVAPAPSAMPGTSALTGLPGTHGIPGVQRRADAGSIPALPWLSPAPSSPSGRGLSPTSRGQSPSGAAPRGPLALARHQPAAPAAAAAPSSPVVARMVADPATQPMGPVVQPSPASGGTTVGSLTATPVVQRVDGAAPAAAPEAQGRSETELDELARALFGRIRTHLRAEVIHEREAKGLTFDAF
ncbi:MAG: hypothetical protein ACYC65_04085 [Candidatus Limnocylindrales bacterium]